MAELATSDSSPDTGDRDFDPTADMLVHEYDDEQTLDEEEAMSGGSCSGELDDLQKEGDMPLDQLLAMYGYDSEGTTRPPVTNEPQESRSSSEEEILSNQDLTLDKDEIARDLLKNIDTDKETSANELLDAVEIPSQTVRLLRSANSQGDSSDEDSVEDVEYEPTDDWKKTISVGHDFQASIPVGLCKYGDAPAYENEDRLLWDPHKLSDNEVENFLCEVHKQTQLTSQGLQAIPKGKQIRDDEQALYLLLQCGHNQEEALRRRKMQAVPPTDPMSLWSEEECRNFENGLRTNGKDFYLIQQQKVRTRSVGELVQFYYLWKKTERHDIFANKTRLEKKKYVLHPGVTDYMDRFLNEQENPMAGRDRAASPMHSLLYGDPKRNSVDLKDSAELQAALEMVQKVVPPEVFSDIKLHPELHTATTTMPTAVSISADIRDNQQSAENLVHIANFTPQPVATATEEPLPPEDSANGMEPLAKRLRTDTSGYSPSSSASPSLPSSMPVHPQTEQPAAEASSASEKSVTPTQIATSVAATPEYDASSNSNHVDVAVSSGNSNPPLGSKVSPAATPVPAEGATAESVAQ